MLRNCHCATGFDAIHPHTVSTAASTWPAAAALWSMWDAFRESLAAHRQYEKLRSRGIPHDRALRESLGFGVSRDA